MRTAEVGVMSHDQVCWMLTVRARKDLEAAGATEEQITRWMNDTGDTRRMYVANENRPGVKVQFRLCCFDKELNRLLYKKFAHKRRGGRKDHREKMWTMDVKRVRLSDSPKKGYKRA